MKVTSVDINALNSENFINLSFRDPTNKNPYVAKEILGLDADEIMLNFSGSASISKERYYSPSLTKRDVIVKAALNPNYSLGETYSTLRDELYRLIASSKIGAVQLRFKNGNTVVAVLTGFITKLESPQFTKSPEVHLTIDCNDDRMLKAPTSENVNVTGLNPQSTTIIDDKSTAPHGFQFGVRFTTNIIKFSIQDGPTPDWIFEVNLTGSSLLSFNTGDELHFSSEHNNKYLYLVRGSSTYHLVDRIIPSSIWPELFPGNNLFTCSGSVVWTYIKHVPTFWGV